MGTPNTKLDDAIEELEKQLAGQQLEVKNTKIAINSLLKILGKSAKYTEAEEQPAQVDMKFQADQWFGQPLAKAAREYLQQRRAAQLGPASAEDIFAGLKQGGYQFEGKDGLQLRGMAISLSKNTATFTRLPNGNFGLTEWYPNLKDSKKKKIKETEQGSMESNDTEAEQVEAPATESN